jgi:prepilin-type processing-associated H-X9-DG protein
MVGCSTQIKSIGWALQLYSSDYNYKYPPPEKWCDLLVEGYGLIDIKSFRCLANRKEQCSFSINPYAEPNSPSDIVLIFESKPGWNQFGGKELLNIENHNGKGCNILFNDGGVEFVSVEHLGKLK